MTRRLAGCVAVALLVAWSACLAVPRLAEAAGTSLTVVGHDPLGGRGMNAAVTVAGRCVYVGSRDDSSPLVVDAADTAAPAVVGHLVAHPGSTPRELRAIPQLQTIAVMFFRLTGGDNGVDLYRWTTDCRRPLLVGHYELGARPPHEFFTWQDPRRPGRVLLFIAMFADPQRALEVVDVSDPVRPVRIGGWSIPAAYGPGARLHSIALSPDGRTAFLSLWTGGLVMADSGDFAEGRAAAALHLLTPPTGALRTPPGDVHSAVPLPGRPAVLITDERYPPPSGPGCPYGSAHVVDVADPAHPAAVGVLAIPENDPATCAAAPVPGTWSSHNATVVGHLAFVSWYSGGLVVFDISDAAHPARLAELRPTGPQPRRRDLELGITAAQTWSYPVVAGGLVYVVDINQGLYILRYRGPEETVVATTRFAEGNSDLTTTVGTATAATATTASPAARGGHPPAATTAAPARVGPPWVTLAASATVGGVTLLLAMALRRAGRARRRQAGRAAGADGAARPR